MTTQDAAEAGSAKRTLDSDSAQRLQQQILFIAEVDRLKGVLRRTSPIGMKRQENSAEHSWQVVLMALLLHEHAREQVDLLKVVRMLAIHDVVEVDVGDTFHYDKAAREDLGALEAKAAQRLFGLLPAAQAAECIAVWEEFEARKTPEARFAAAVDRFSAFILNHHNRGGTWVKHGVTGAQIASLNQHIEQGAPAIWDAAKQFLAQAIDAGRISMD